MAGKTQRRKSLLVAYLLWFFFGILGVHQFYLGKFWRGLGYLLTLGWVGIAWIIDLFTLPSQTERVNLMRYVGYL